MNERKYRRTYGFESARYRELRLVGKPPSSYVNRKVTENNRYIYDYEFSRADNIKARNKLLREGKRVSAAEKKGVFVVPKTDNPNEQKYLSLVFTECPSAAKIKLSDGGGKGRASKSVLNLQKPLAATDYILQVLEHYGGTATFAVYGSTEDNYPDSCGRPSSRNADGIHYPHLPAFSNDIFGGTHNQAGLLRKIVHNGHDLAVSTYDYLPIGYDPDLPERYCYDGMDSAIAGVQRLRDEIYGHTRADSGLFLPPRGIRNTNDGHTVFDLCDRMKMHLLNPEEAFGNDWRGFGRYIRSALQADPSALSGSIIAISGLRPNLNILESVMEMLKSANYSLVSVSELLKKSHFSDLSAVSDSFRPVNYLENCGFAIGYRDNTFAPGRKIRQSELEYWLGSYGKDIPPIRSNEDDEPLAPRSIRLIAQNYFTRMLTEKAKSTGGSAKADRKDQNVKLLSEPQSSRRGDVAKWLCYELVRFGLIAPIG
jgi:peptidoglycan/xylan/chitin deacetylase (PgdA/CDA1 family)